VIYDDIDRRIKERAAELQCAILHSVGAFDDNNATAPVQNMTIPVVVNATVPVVNVTEG